jgi:glycosyltransferase involved in cell wall biosynthesis
MEAMMQSISPLVSIITPAYRCADTLAVALKSLQRQDEWRWESIIVDDGSPDESVQVAGDFAQSDQRFKVISQKNAGACAARNTGLTVARGRYVLFLDADDWMEPGALGAMAGACDRKHWAAVHGGFRYAKPDGSLTQWAGAYNGEQPLFDALASSNVLSLPSCVMLRRSLLNDIGGGFDTSLVHCGDWDLWARMARSECRVGRIDDCVTGYRMRPASLSRNPLTLLRDAQTVLSRIHGRDARVSRPSRRYAHGALSGDLSTRLAGFTFYAGAFAAMQGRMGDFTTVMQSLDKWPELSSRRLAEFLLHAACFARCICPDDLRPLPPDVGRRMEEVSLDLERRTGLDGLAAEVAAELGELGFGYNVQPARVADRLRLERPRSAADTLASEYLRSLALRECVA